MTLALAPILAHQGSWDETLLVLVPLAVFALLLRLANKRAEAAQRQRQEPGDSEP